MSIFDRDDLYAENYYDYRNFRESDKSSGSINEVSWTSVTRLVLAILLRIGFFLVQIGSVPVTNINLILLQNIVDFSWITIVYLIGGFVIAYNGDVSGLVGQGQWIGGSSIIDKDKVLVGWQAAIIASGICTSCLVGRTHIVGYLFIGLIMSGIVQPFAIHWAWTTKGWMAGYNLLDRDVFFRDYAGSTIVHTVGSLTGYIGCSILGRRIIRLRDIDDASIPADSAGTALAGYLLILLGLQSLCFPSAKTADNPRTSEKEISPIVVNNLLGASSCSLVVVALHFILSREPFNHWTVMRCVQASIAGTTILAAGVNFYNPVFCLGLGCTGGIIHYLVSRRVFQSALEDYCNIVATHLICSLVGTLVAPFGRTTSKTMSDPLAMLANASWQVICLVAIVALVTVSMSLAFGLLECLGLLRNRSEIVNHLRAIVAAERGPSRSYMQRIFLPEGETLYLQPCKAHIRPRANESVPRFLDNRDSTIRNQKPQELVDVAEKSANTRVSVSTSSPSVVERSTRVKKLRQVHTLRSTSEMVIFETEKYGEAKGDDRKSDEKIPSSADVKKNYDSEKISMIEQCSGDSSTERPRIKDYSLIEKFAIDAPMEIKIGPTTGDNASEKNLKRRHEPYRLRRTQKFTNLRLEAINENNASVKFLVRPRARSFSSTESDSEDEKFDTIREKYPRNLATSVPIASVRKTLECTDIRS